MKPWVQATELLGGIYLIEAGYTNVYLVEHEGDFALIDAGPPGSLKAIREYMDSLGLDPAEIRLVILTHSHWDHAGGLSEIYEEFRPRIAAHRLEARYVSEGKPPLGRSYKPVPVDLLLDEGDIIHGLRVLHTPGHTPGSICLLHGAEEALFSDDLVYELDGELYEIPSQYSLDPEGNRESIRRMAGLSFKHLLPSHGRPVLHEGREKLLSLLERLDSYNA
jgi:glyoxylase-like metal-dependent hydrolase (beta-lactamase superfamily II)